MDGSYRTTDGDGCIGVSGLTVSLLPCVVGIAADGVVEDEDLGSASADLM